MYLKKSMAVAAVMLSLSSAHAASALSTQSQYTLVKTIPGMVGWRMNDAGQIAGRNQRDQVLLFTPGSGETVLPFPDGVAAMYGYHLNESGQVGGPLSYRGSYWGPTYTSYVYTPGAASPYRLSNDLDPRLEYKLDDAGNFVRQQSGTPDWAVDRTIPTDAAGQYIAGYSYFNTRNSYGAAWRQNPDGSFTNWPHVPGCGEPVLWRQCIRRDSWKVHPGQLHWTVCLRFWTRQPALRSVQRD
jgi:hypothetical protein